MAIASGGFQGSYESQYAYERLRQEERLRGAGQMQGWNPNTMAPQQAPKQDVFEKDNRNDNLLLLLENVI
jgi:hypothetical protein